MTVVVVTDSSACIGFERGGSAIAVAPLHVFVDGVDLREGVDTIPEDFAAQGPVTTAGASPSELTDLYADALDRSGGDGVVAVHISRGLSSTWEAARQAAAAIGDRVRVVDSASAGMGLGYVVLAAARSAANGDSLDDVYDTAASMSARTSSFIVVDRLDHLRRGGRIGAAAALLGTALAMKPVLHLTDGKLVLGEKARTSTKALGKLVDTASRVAEGAAGSGDDDLAMTVHHMLCPDRADTVVSMLRERIAHPIDIDVVPFGAVLGAHVGPGAVGVVVAQ
ncbi:DegV family protein [Rhodococcus sp. 06-156-3C]|uniref:DegV family protein n=1 Tax=Nocardiaceae TaxID=85025 RepID=UPI000522E651|nr:MULTISPECIES: DegV family protein [Rhodococcus]OZD12815.1 DegV family protein [Rhodococcus sp. 06-156-4C]OZD24439.1 DegV family protein [Rhodococcus sp. 06-156-3C]OZD27549.1 DegV family protein [Rhodococcus sp. 06-156-4a]OZD37313.1 DegV family protein [Rhodococcus sp. 06-156-3b]OZD41245.1 DegV family protein [Rhodococcus sp. 06-156-3]